MKSKLLLLILLFIIAAFIFKFSSNTPEVSRGALTTEQMEKMLSDVSIDSLKIDNQSYSLKWGEVQKTNQEEPSDSEKREVLQLALFYQWTKEDPLFTSPDFDPASFSASVNILEKQEEEFKRLIKKKIPFFPTSLLKTIPGVSNQEKVFFEKPDLENAQKLINLYGKTAQSYKNEIEKYYTHIKQNEKNFSDSNLVYINVYTNKKIYFSDLEKIIINAKALENEISKRNNCLTNGVKCARPSFFFKEPEIEKASLENFPLLPLSVLFPLLDASKYSEIKGPYVINTPCWGWEENFNFPAQPIYIYNTNNLSGLKFKLGTQNFYRKRGNITFYDKNLTKLGIKDREMQLETNVYMCLNLEYQPKLMTLINFLEQNSPIYSMVDEKDIPDKYRNFWIKSKKLEEEFFKSQQKNYQDLETLSNTYAFAYRILGESNIDSKIKGQFLKRYLIIDRKLSGFSSILNAANSQFKFTLATVKNEPEIYASDNNLYMSIFLPRSLWNLLYFSFSSSFWRYDEKLRYLEKGKIDENYPLKDRIFINYQEALTLYKAEELKQWEIMKHDYELKKMYKDLF